mgnify:CR=1 FL=1
MTAAVHCQFSKRERLVSRQLIETLFNGGGSRSMSAYPLRAVFLVREQAPGAAVADSRLPGGKGTYPAQLLLSVPKRRFRHAVDRNRVKRQLRECFRRHKQVLYDAVPPDRQVLLALVWLADSHRRTEQIEDAVKRLLQRISEKL